MSEGSLTGKISEQLQTIDRYSKPIHLNVEGKDSFKSLFGAIVSLAVIICLIVLFSTKVAKMMHHDNPQIIELDEFQNDPGLLSLSQSSNFIFAIGITVNGVYNNMTKNSIVSFSSTYNQNHRSQNGTVTKFKSNIHWTPCEYSEFPESIFGPNAFALYSLGYMYCPKYIDFTLKDGSCPSSIKEEYPNCQTPPNFIIKGVYLSIDFEFVQFKFTKCKPSDADHLAGLQCETSSAIAAAFSTSEVKINAYFTNMVINPVEYETPNKTYIDSIYWTVDPSVSKLADVFMDQQIVQTYDSYIYNDRSRNNSFYSIKQNTMREIQVFQSSSLLEFNLRRSNLNHVTTRTYTKLLDILGSVGGIAEFILLIGGILLLNYVSYRYKMKLSNELYDFESLEEKQSQETRLATDNTSESSPLK